MVNFNDVYINNEQPTWCPKCGNRTEIILDLSHTIEQTQIHKCLNKICQEKFITQFDLEFVNRRFE